MIRHDYVCNNCSKVFEVGVPMNQNGKPIRCPHCKRQMKKIYIKAPAGVVR